MTPAIHPYSDYKPSGIPWLGDVPAHWEVRRLKQAGRLVAGAGFPVPLQGVQDEELPFFKVGDLAKSVDGRWLSYSDSTISRETAASLRAQVIPKGAIAYAKIGEALRLNRRRIIARPACIDNNMTAFVPNSTAITIKWALHSLSMLDFGKHVNPGAVPSLSEGDQAVLSIPLPPLPEQAPIVRYLDHADRRIRRYVSAKRKLIALLAEEKQAIINRAVTRGLDPNVRLKPSGVEWLGDVPEHWEVRRGKRLFSPRRELARPDDVQLAATQAYGVIPQDEYEQRVGRRIVKISLHLNKRRHVEVDDFVISMRSFQGGLERAWATGCIRSSYIVLRPTMEVDVELFSYLLKSQAYIQALRSTANFIRDGQDLTFNNFCAVDLPFPPAEEQRKIAVASSRATAHIDSAIVRARRQIELLQEYRTRLVADVVTGKLDVREAAALLPDDLEDEDPVDEGSPLAEDTYGDSHDPDVAAEELAMESEVAG